MALFEEKKIQKTNTPEQEKTGFFDEKHIETDKKKKTKRTKILSSFAEVSPIIDMTDSGYFQMNNNEGYMEIVQLTSKDVYALNQTDVEKAIMQFAYFNQWYVDDYKIVPLNFPEDTSNQQRNMLERLNKPKKPQYEKFLRQKLNELQFIETDRTNREYYMFLYADDEYTLYSRVKNVERLLYQVLPVVRLTEDKKINILYKLFNLNAKNKTTGRDA